MKGDSMDLIRELEDISKANNGEKAVEFIKNYSKEKKMKRSQIETFIIKYKSKLMKSSDACKYAKDKLEDIYYDSRVHLDDWRWQKELTALFHPELNNDRWIKHPMLVNLIGDWLVNEGGMSEDEWWLLFNECKRAMIRSKVDDPQIIKHLIKKKELKDYGVPIKELKEINKKLEKEWLEIEAWYDNLSKEEEEND